MNPITFAMRHPITTMMLVVQRTDREETSNR
jgi:hypothetical protein